MYKLGDRVQMTKGYRGISGVIGQKTDSPFEMYVLALDTGIKTVAGPSAFVREEGMSRQRHRKGLMCAETPAC
jgi:hypothetical protein